MIDLFVVTGYLGSGKSTLLRNLLRAGGFRDSAIIINELGVVPVDHHLIAFAAESTVVLPGGCICCARREDIEESLRELLERRDRGAIPSFRRVIVETSGAADPVPLLATLIHNPMVRERLSHPVVITVIDGLLGLSNLAASVEARSQVVQADRVVISKADIVPPSQVVDMTRHIQILNSDASIVSVNLLTDDLAAAFDPSDRKYPGSSFRHSLMSDSHALSTHGGATDLISTLSVVLDEKLNWNGFAAWVTLLLHRYGNRVLRIKGVLQTENNDRPIVFQTVQHLVHEPLHVDEWPSSDRRSRLVFVARDLDLTRVETSLRAFQTASKRVRHESADRKPISGGGVINGHPVRRPNVPAWIKG